MADKDARDDDLSLTKKELYSLKSNEFVKRDLTTDLFSHNMRDFLNVHTHQLFCRNFFNVDSKHRGLILEHDTGTGKTITACAIIKTFVTAYKKLYDNIASKTQTYGLEKLATLESETPYVLIVGFEGTQEAFFRELTNYPEFGIVTPIERDAFVRARHATEKIDATVDDRRRYRDLYLKYRRRLTDKAAGGFFNFKGFQELVNYIFDTSNAEISLDYIEKLAAKSDKSAAEVFEEFIRDGTFRPRKENIMKFKNSLIVADELHNTYNSVGKNSRGIVLQYLIDNVPGIRFLGLSATLLNSSPAEFVDVLNYLVIDKLKREDYFVQTPSGLRFARPSVPDELGRLSHGYFSFLKDSNPKYYPKLMLAGTELQTETGPVKYQRFYQVPMSREQQAAHEIVVSEHGIDPDTGRIKVPINSEIVFDMTLPMPPDAQQKYLSSTDQVYRVLNNADSKFLDANGIVVNRDAEGYRLSGPFLINKADGLQKWSPKYSKMLDELMLAKGKCVIFHKKVMGSGVLLIEEILKSNGYIGESAEPHNDTICVSCGHRLKEHKKTSSGQTTYNQIYAADFSEHKLDDGHHFIPARYMLVYGQNKDEIPGILQRYNSQSNSDGKKYKVLIGSKVIRESYDFKDVRHMFMVDCPTNISMTLQIYGRSVRKNSHIALDPEYRTVTIHTIVSVIDPQWPSSTRDSAEAQRYKAKMDAYLLIQEVDKYRHMYAVDAAINRGTIWPRGNPGKDSLGALYYEPSIDVEPGLKLSDLNTTTFRSNKFFNYEIATLSMIIKRMFINKSIWTYIDLWRACRDPPFPVETNPNFFDEDLFMVTLSQLVNAPNFSIDDSINSSMPMSILINRLVDPSERRITLGNGVYRIVHCVNNVSGANSITSGYYIMVPCDQTGNPVIDVDIYDQQVPKESRRTLNIDSLLAGSHAFKRYKKIRKSVIDSLEDASELDDFADFLLSWPVAIQEYFIQDCIRVQAKFPVHDITDSELRSLKDVSTLVLSGLQLMGSLITFEEMKLYKLSGKYYKKEYPVDTIMGYESLESVRIISADGTFTDIGKTVLNRMEIYRESGQIIGYIEDTPGTSAKFKLRKASGAIDADSSNYERGIVCSTKTKEQLLVIIKMLGIKPDVHRTKSYCRDIFMTLLDREIEAREEGSKNKFIYAWWNKMPGSV